MSKKSTVLLLVLAVLQIIFSSAPTLAENYLAECQTPKGKYRKCNLEFSGSTLSVQYATEKNKEFNLIIPKEQIKEVIEGTSKKGGIGVYVGPVNFGGLLKKTMHDFLIQYLDSKNEPKDVLVRVKKKDGTAMATSLRDLQGGQE